MGQLGRGVPGPRSWVAALLGAVLLLATWGSTMSIGGGISQAAKPRSGGTLTVGIQTPPDSLDPDEAPAAEDYRVMREIFDSLLYLTPKGVLKPWLATSWSMSNGGKTYTFKLRQGVKFQDGTPFNGAAVCYNFDRIVSPAEASRYAISLLGPYQSCSAPNPTTAVVNFKTAYSPFLVEAASAFMGMVSPTAAKQEGPQQFMLHPVGSGPFSFVSYTLNSQIVLKRNPDYNWAPSVMKHQGPAYLKGIIFKIVPDDTTRIGSVQSGQLLSAETVPAQLVASVKGNSKLTLNTVPVPGAPYQLQINSQHAPWNQLKAREALRDAIDVPTIISSIYFKSYPQAWGPLAPGTVGYDKAVVHSWHYNPKQANKLLNSLGWVKGSNGIREKDGKQLTLLYQEGTPNRDKRQDVATFIAQELSQVGIKVTTSFLTAAAGTASIEAGNYDVAGLSLVNGDGSDLWDEYDSANQPGNGKFGFDESHTDSAQLDQWLNEALQSTNTSQKDALYAKAQKYVDQNVLSIPIYVPDYIFVYSKSVHQVEYDQGGYPEFYDTYMSSSAS